MDPEPETESSPSDVRLLSKAAMNPPTPGLQHIAFPIVEVIWGKQALRIRRHPGDDYESYHVDKFAPTMTQRQQNRPQHGLSGQSHDTSEETNIPYHRIRGGSFQLSGIANRKSVGRLCSH